MYKYLHLCTKHLIELKTTYKLSGLPSLVLLSYAYLHASSFKWIATFDIYILGHFRGFKIILEAIFINFPEKRAPRTFGNTLGQFWHIQSAVMCTPPCSILHSALLLCAFHFVCTLVCTAVCSNLPLTNQNTAVWSTPIDRFCNIV